ncbi:MAG: flagellar hook-length control protein FliK [Cellulosilyticaceae bacterium]
MNPAMLNLIAQAPNTAQATPKNVKNSSAFKESMDATRKEQITDSKVSNGQTKDVSSKSNDPNGQTEMTASVKKQEILQSEPLEQVDEAMMEEQMALLIQQFIQILGISPEEFQKHLENLGLGALDLLNEENFTAVIGEIVGQEEIMLTLDQDVIKQIGELREAFVQLEGMMLAQNQDEPVMLQTQPLVEQMEVVEETLPKVSAELKQDAIVEEHIIAKEIIAPIQTTQEQTSNKDYPTEDQEQMIMPEVKDLIELRMPIQGFQIVQEAKVWAQTEEMQHIGSAVTSKMVTDQVIQKIEITKLLMHNEIQMELTPKELGKVAMKLVEQNGVITAQIKVESEKTKELLLQNLEGLKQGLEQQGLTIGNFAVDVHENESKSQMQQQKQKASKRIEEIIAKQMRDLAQEVEQEPIEENNTLNQVDYMA